MEVLIEEVTTIF